MKRAHVGGKGVQEVLPIVPLTLLHVHSIQVRFLNPKTNSVEYVTPKDKCHIACHAQREISL